MLLHSNTDVVEVFLVQHAAQQGDAPDQQQQAVQQQHAAPAPMQSQQDQQQQQLLESLVQQQATSLHLQQQAAAAAIAGPDITMEHPGGLGAAQQDAAAGRSSHRPPSLQPHHMDSAAAAAPAPQPSPITLLAKAIGSGGITAADISVGAPASLVKQEQQLHPAAGPGSHAAPGAAGGSCATPNFAAMAGLNSPLFPAGLSSPNLTASPAQNAKWSEIDPEVWFEGDGSALGALGDFFKNDTSIFHPATGDQDIAGVAAW